MVSASELIVAAAIAAVVYFAREWFLSQRDVHPLYLEEQSAIEATRLEGQSAIYRSNKLDLPEKLRIGLDIRYDHYKLRNGNLHDVWAIFANNNGANIVINGCSLSVPALNYRVTQISQALRLQKVSEVVISFKTYQKLGFSLLAVILAAFVLNVTVHIASSDAETEGDSSSGVLKLMLVSAVDSFVTLAFEGVAEPTNELLEFPNVYDPKADKGVFLKLTSKKLAFQSTVEYQVINAISAIAATLKHLPLYHELSSNDSFLIVQDIDAESVESVASEIIKLLSALTASAKVIILNDDSDPLAVKPTVMALPQTYYLTLALTNRAIIPDDLVLSPFTSWILTQLVQLRENLLSRGIMVTYGSKFAPLRLIYVHKPMGYGMHPLIEDSNQARSLFQCRIVVEHTWPTILGPVLATDFYDYRVLPIHVRSYGALSQNLEFKLVNLNENNEGTIAVRGFSIGKLINKKNGIVESTTVAGDDGFMPIPLPSKFGKDGLLYVL